MLEELYFDIFHNSISEYTEPEWGFPKGRRNTQEKDYDCALREFSEETGYNSSVLNNIRNIVPFEEIFMGTNNKTYKNKYFVGFMKDNIDLLDNYQKNEISKIEWKTLEECLQNIRFYHFEKKQLILNIDFMLKKYQII
jgi:8-oxo-dGTP pyrophosphatase MutT (NUDIX family)